MMAGLGPTEIIIIALVIVLLFGARKLPDAARGIGRSLRIFKAETKGLRDDDDARDPAPPVAPPAALPTPPPVAPPTSTPVAKEQQDARRDSA
ncbi:MAG TPA: Sec-independent protein translocase subunit TatA [Pseudonocardiaceae bacterium]